MASTTHKTEVWVYAHWQGMPNPRCIGVLSAHQGKGKKAFSFEYDPAWLHSEAQIMIDPGISWYTGPQFPATIAACTRFLTTDGADFCLGVLCGVGPQFRSSRPTAAGG